MQTDLAPTLPTRSGGALKARCVYTDSYLEKASQPKS